MTATLASLRDRVETLISDQINMTFSTGMVDEGIRAVLDRYSGVRPLRAIDTLNITAEGREVDIADLAGLIEVKRVWLPYTASDPEHPPRWQPFEHWADADILYLPGAYLPQVGDVARIFYTKQQTLQGLDAATETSFPDADETLLIIGASGYTVLPRARSATEEVMLADQVPLSGQIIAWSKMQIGEFQRGLDQIARQQAIIGKSRIFVGKLDRWDQFGGGWA